MKKLLLLSLLLLTSINFYGQLNVGDIAIIGMNTDAEDSFSFITLRDIPGSEKIYFTDRGVKNSTTWNVGVEGTTLFTAPVAGIPIGTIIRIEETAADVLTITGVTGATISIVQGSFNLAGGDQMSAYQPDSPGVPASPSGATFLTAIHTDYDAACVDPATKWTKESCVSSTSESTPPPGLTNGTSCVSITPAGPEKDNFRYTGVLTGTSTAVFAAINNHINWAKNNSPRYDISASGYTVGTITYVAPCTAPTVPTVSYSPTTVCAGSTTTLSISGTLNDATSWHIYTGSCGGTEIGTTAGTTFVVTPSSPSTTYYVRGEGGCTTPGSCASVTVNVTAIEDASFNYGAASYSVNDADPTPTITGTAGGSFSSTAGLNINASTGKIDVSASTIASYTVTYTTGGTCSASSTQNVTITAASPTVSTTAAASITTTGATLAGNATADGGSAITERGIVWSVTATNNNPVIGGASVTKDTNGSGTGIFSEAIAGFTEATQYSYKAYATNGIGTSYGAVMTFTTLANAPTVTTTAAASITTTDATLAGNASADGGAGITERGIVYSVTSTNGNPIIGGAGVTKDTNGSGTGVFSEAISGLIDNTEYSYKAYATNGVGTSYGAVQTFTTLTIPATHLNFDSGTNDQVSLGTGINTILDPINTFTVEAWVRPESNVGLGAIIGNYDNGVGTMQFLLRRDGTNYTFWVSAGNGFKNVTSAGGVTLNTWTHIVGVWNGSTTKIYINGALSNTTVGVTGANFITQTNPIKIGVTDGGENFDGDIEEVRMWTKGLSATEISTRKDIELFGNEDGLLAYYKFNQGTNNANNAAETTLTDNSTNAYNGTLTNFALTGTTSNWASGSAISTSGVAPTVTTTAAASITTTGATLAGNASADGGAGITERGIVYSVTATNGDPLIGGASVTKIVKGLGTGVFSDAVTGLSESTEYSYKAYAINGVGTSYGAVTTFTTSSVPPTVTTYLPADNATGVVVGDNLVLTFSENIVKGTGNIVIKKTSDNTTIETIDVTTAAVSISGVTATINPSSDLALNTEFYVQMASGVFKDAATNNYAGIADTTTWSFTTEANQTNTWSGATDTNWATITNWSLGRTPISTDNVIIADVANDPVVFSGTHTIVNDVTINASGLLTITGGADITVNGNSTNNGTFNIESGGSLIVNGTSTGNMTYKRNLATTNWYLISSPVVGVTVQNLYDFGIFALNGFKISFALYLNDGTSWSYAEDAFGTIITNNVTLTKGYSVRLAGAGDITFVGTMPTTDINIAITDGAANEFNLIGNPYPSYLPANTNADAVKNILTVNAAQLQEQTLWFWDQSTSSYTQINQASASKFIPPAQGFFVNAKLGGGTFAFTEAMQSHQATDAFSRTTTENRFEIKLAMTDGTATKNTEIYYINGTTTAFDNGYDSSIFGGANNDFAVYTQTVTNSQGRKLGIQSLPDANYENMTIPVGVNATAGTEITFSIAAQNIPTGMDIYLENRVDNTFTKLNDNGGYTITLSADSNGVGQFYLRTSSSALGLENVTLDGVSMYTTSNDNLRIIGLQTGKATVKIFTLLGKQVLQTSFESTGVKDVGLPKLSAGVYLVNVQTAQGKLTKKIIIE